MRSGFLRSYTHSREIIREIRAGTPGAVRFPFGERCLAMEMGIKGTVLLEGSLNALRELTSATRKTLLLYFLPGLFPARRLRHGQEILELPCIIAREYPVGARLHGLKGTFSCRRNAGREVEFKVGRQCRYIRV